MYRMGNFSVKEYGKLARGLRNEIEIESYFSSAILQISVFFFGSFN